MDDKQCYVSDHAILRWIERIYGIDMEALRREILSPAVVRAIHAGATKFNYGGRVYKLEPERRLVCTVYPSEAEDWRNTRRKGGRYA